MTDLNDNLVMDPQSDDSPARGGNTSEAESGLAVAKPESPRHSVRIPASAPRALDQPVLDDITIEGQPPRVIEIPEPDEERPALGRDYVKLWLATAISNIGDGARLTALPLLAATITHDPVAIATLMFAGKLPWLLLSLHAGAVADRLDRRLLIGTVNLLRCVVMGILAVAAITGNVSLPLLYAVAMVQGVGEVFSDNAAFALLPSLVSRKRLEDANGRLEAAVIVSNEFAGPALGGLLFAITVALPFSLDAASFILAAGLIFSITPRGSHRQEGEIGERTSLRQDIAEGLRWMWAHKVLRNLSLIAAVTNLVLFATFGIQVLFALEVLGLSPAGFGLLLTAEAVGAMVGSLVASKFRKKFGLTASIVIALGVAAAANLVIATSSGWMLVGAMAMAVSLGGGLWNVLTNSFRQSVVPDRLLGRVQSSHRMLSWGAIPIGTLIGGAISRAFGLHAPFLVAGIVLAILAVAIGATIARFETHNDLGAVAEPVTG